jgi:hypothetical protein
VDFQTKAMLLFFGSEMLSRNARLILYVLLVRKKECVIDYAVIGCKECSGMTLRVREGEGECPHEPREG